MARVLIIEARFYDHINDGLLKGATDALEAAKIGVDRITVPGIFEIPGALAFVIAAQKAGTIERYDGYVVLGCAIQGETDHYAHICVECMSGINDLIVAHHLALGNGVLTVHDEAQALERADPERKNIGSLAARACIRMMDLRKELKL